MPNVTVDDIRKSTGRAYQMITLIMERYKTKPSLMFWTNLEADLKEAAKKACEEDKMFPVALWLAMGDIVLRWHWNGCKGVDESTIKPMMQEVWKYHREQIGKPQTDDNWDVIYKAGNDLATGKSEIERDFIVAALRDIERRNPKPEQASSGENGNGGTEVDG